MLARKKESKRGWKPQTMHRECVAMQTALNDLPKFSTGMPVGLRLSEIRMWTHFVTHWERQLPASQPLHQPAATSKDIKRALECCNGDAALRVFFVLLWVTTGRKGDVMKLQTLHVTLSSSGRITALIQSGKGVIARKGAYHIVTLCPPEWFDELRAFLAAAAAEKRKFLFPQTEDFSESIPRILKLANPALDGCRSVRRGALIRIASDPNVTEDILMKLSGHRSRDTLHRYLDWNRVNENMHQRSEKAAANLFPDSDSDSE